MEDAKEIEKIIGYVVKKIHQDQPKKQIGKTLIQKYMFLLTREKIVKLDYSLHNYGPFSRDTESSIEDSELDNFIDVDWVSEKGYFIIPGESSSKIQIDEPIRAKIDSILEKYSSFNAVELSFIATAFYIIDEEPSIDEELSVMVHRIKNNYSIQQIKDVLTKAGLEN